MIDLLQAIWPTLAFLDGIDAAFLLLRNRATPISSLDGVVESGRPAVVEVYSNM